MTPAAIIAGARADGILLALAADGGLSFKGPRAAAERWVPLLKHAKPALVSHLRLAQREVWDTTDWKAHFGERASIAEFDGGLPRSEAEARAWQCCLAEWLVGHAMQSDPGRCHWCGETGLREPLVPYGTTTTGHTWLHATCWSAWYRSRKCEAAAALNVLGIKLAAEARRTPASRGARSR